MGTFIIVGVLVLFLAAIFTGGYNKEFLHRVQGSRIWDWVTTVDHKKIGILYYMLVGSLPQGAHSLHDSQATLSRSVSGRLALLRPDNRTAPGCQDRCTREQAVRSVLMDLGD